MRRHRGKLYGAAIGFTFGGPIGAIIGAAAGHLIDSTEQDAPDRPGGPGFSPQRELAFLTSLALLLAGTARADGKITESEKNTIKDFFKNQLGYGPMEYRFIERIVEQSFVRPLDLEETCAAISGRTSYEERLFLVSLNYQIAVSDGALNETEEAYIEDSARLLGIERYDYTMIKNRFKTGGTGPQGKNPPSGGPADPYAVLGVSKASPNDEIVKAYRSLAAKYHPDKVSHLGREFIDLATQKFTCIQRAYEEIRIERAL